SFPALALSGSYQKCVRCQAFLALREGTHISISAPRKQLPNERADQELTHTHTKTHTHTHTHASVLSCYLIPSLTHIHTHTHTLFFYRLITSPLCLPFFTSVLETDRPYCVYYRVCVC